MVAQQLLSECISSLQPISKEGTACVSTRKVLVVMGPKIPARMGMIELELVKGVIMSSVPVPRKLPLQAFSLLLCLSSLVPAALADSSTGTAAQSQSQTSGETNSNPFAGDVTGTSAGGMAADQMGGTGSNNNSGTAADGLGGSTADNTYWSLGVSPRVIIDQRAAAEANRKRYEQAFVRPPKVEWNQFKGRRNGSLQANSCLMRKTKGVWEVISDPIMEKYPDPDSAQAQTYKRRVLGLPPLPSAGGGGQTIIPQVKRQAPTQTAPQPGSTSGSALKG